MLIPAALETAVRCHEAGSLNEAALLYTQILNADATQANVWNLLGLVEFQRGNDTAAIECYQQAIKLNPAYAQAFANLALVLNKQGNVAGAIANYKQALQYAPNYPEVLNDLGCLFKQEGKHLEAVECFSRALELRPDFPQAHCNLGIALHALGKLEEAHQHFVHTLRLKSEFPQALNSLGTLFRDQGKLEQARSSLQKAIELNPAFAEAHYNLGVVWSDLRELTEAIESYRSALRAQPRFPQALNNLGSIFLHLERLSEAEEHFARAAELQPTNAEIHYNLGLVLQRQDRVQQAAECYRRALSIDSRHYDALINLGAIHREEIKLHEAASCFRAAIAAKPNSATAYNNLGLVLREAGNFPDALDNFSKALALQPDYASARFNQSFVSLINADFLQGWPDFEWRWKVGQIVLREFNAPMWDGTPLDGKTILLHAEQGYGDVLQFVRYATLVKSRGARVVVACQNRLVNLLQRSPGIDELVPCEGELPTFDTFAPLLSLPGILHTTLDTIPRTVPYIFADPALTARWLDSISHLKGFRIGINWRGRSSAGSHRQRDIPLSCFRKVAELAGIRLISLQKDARDELAAAGIATIVELGDDVDTLTGAFMDTAAVMVNLDLVITSDTSIAHLAGALGVPVWVALPFVPDWRWLLDRSDSPWYPTMRLFRQKQPGDWTGVFEEMRTELGELIGRARPPMSPA